MKQIRFLREPRGRGLCDVVESESSILSRPGGHHIVWLRKGVELFVPDELADLLTAPRCPECGTVSTKKQMTISVPDGTLTIESSKPGDKCSYCVHVCETAEEVGILVPGLAEEVEP